MKENEKKMFIETKVQLLFLKGGKRTFIDYVIVLCAASKGLASYSAQKK